MQLRIISKLDNEREFSKKLLVEGNDDKHVLYALFEKFKIPENFDLIDCEGVENLLIQIPVRLKQSGLTTLGIMLDADFEVNKRWISVKSIFEELGFKLPNEPVDGGTIVTNGGVQIGIWLMPNNKVNGMLEDFITYLLPHDDKLMEHVDGSLKVIEEAKAHKYINNHKSKAKIHTWLSWQQDPGTPLGLAITKKYLAIDGKPCSDLISWVSNLFK